MNTLTAQPITLEQYASFKSPAGFRDELIEGEIILSPDPKVLHQEIAHRFCRNLERILEGSAFVARQRTNMQMPQDHSMPSPDIFVIDIKRWKAALEANGYPQQSPQLVVEVISQANRKKNVARKTSLYLKNGASAVWVVYPNRRRVRVFSGSQEAELCIAYLISLPPPLPHLSLKVKNLFDVSFANE